MFAPFSYDVDGINNERQIVLRKRNCVVALKGLKSNVTLAQPLRLKIPNFYTEILVLYLHARNRPLGSDVDRLTAKRIVHSIYRNIQTSVVAHVPLPCQCYSCLL